MHHAQAPAKNAPPAPLPFLLSLEAPLHRGLQAGVHWLASWIPASLRAHITHSAQQALDSLVAIGQSLPVHTTLPLTWEAPQRGGPDYWAAHLTTVIDDIIETPPLSPMPLHHTLLDLQHCIGPHTLSPWTLDRGLKALQQHYTFHAPNTALLAIINQHRCYLRDQLLKNPHHTTQLLQAELHYVYRHGLQKKYAWKDLCDMIVEYARVLPAPILQSALHTLQQALKGWCHHHTVTPAQYHRYQHRLQKTRAHIAQAELYQHYHTPLTPKNKNKTPLNHPHHALWPAVTLFFATQAMTSRLLPPSLNLTLAELSAPSLSLFALSANALRSLPLQEKGMHYGSTIAYSLSWLSEITAQQTGCDSTTPPSALQFNEAQNLQVMVLQESWVAGWQSQGNLYIQLFENNGSSLTTPVLLSNSSVDAKFEMLNLARDGWVTAWQQNDGLYVQAFQNNGSLSEVATPGYLLGLNSTNSVLDLTQAHNMGLQLLPFPHQASYTGVWQSHWSNGCLYDIYVGLYQQDIPYQLVPTGIIYKVNKNMQGQQYNPQIAISDATNRLLVVWISQPNAGYQLKMGIYYQLLTANLEHLLLDDNLIDVGSGALEQGQETCGFLPDPLQVAAHHDGGFLMSWWGDQYCDKRLQGYVWRLDRDGKAVSFQQSMSVNVLPLTPSPFNLTSLEDMPFTLPTLWSIYSPAGNVTVKLRFTVAQLVDQPQSTYSVNPYSQSPQINITKQHSDQDGIEWWIQGHFYHVNQAWNQIQWTPAEDFHGAAGSLSYQIEDGDHTLDSPSFQPVALTFWITPVNDPPEVRPAFVNFGANLLMFY